MRDAGLTMSTQQVITIFHHPVSRISHQNISSAATSLRLNLISMKASTERKIIRWVHLILSIPIIGYIYGPVSEIEEATTMVRWVFLPVIVLSGLWLWKGHWVKQRLR
jgi:hypothetical protein